MINNQLIKNLANSTLDENGNVNSKLANYALNKLKKKELKIFLKRIVKLNSEKAVTVTTTGKLTKELKNKIENMFRNKKIMYEQDSKSGGGIKIKDNDMIINYTISGMIDKKLMVI